MATKFRIAVVALQKAKKEPTVTNLGRAVERCRAEYARGGSVASMDMLHEAEAMLRGATRDNVSMLGV